MDYSVEGTVCLEQGPDLVLGCDVGICGKVVGCFVENAVPIPECVPFRSKEHLSHVVIRTDDGMTLGIEVCDSFSTNQTITSRYQNLHFESPRIYPVCCSHQREAPKHHA